MKMKLFSILLILVFFISCKKDNETNVIKPVDLRVEKASKNYALISWPKLDLDSTYTVFLTRLECQNPLVLNDSSKSFDRYEDFSKVYQTINRYVSIGIDRNSTSFVDSTFELTPNIFYYLSIANRKEYKKSKIVKLTLPDLEIFSIGEPKCIRFDKEENILYILGEDYKLVNYKLSNNTLTSVNLSNLWNTDFYIGSNNGIKEIYISKVNQIEIRDALTLEFKESIKTGRNLKYIHRYSDKYWFLVSSTADSIFILDRTNNKLTPVDRPGAYFPYYGISKLISVDTALYVFHPFQVTKFDINKNGSLHFNKTITLDYTLTNYGYGTDYFYMKSTNSFFCTLGLEINRDLEIISNNKYNCINTNMFFDDSNNEIYQSVYKTKKIICYDVKENVMILNETKYSLFYPVFLFRKDNKLRCISRFGNAYCIEEIN